MDDLGWVGLEVRPDVSGVGTSLDRQFDSVGRSSGRRFGLSFGRVAGGVAAGVVGTSYAAISIGKDAYAEAKEARKVGALTAQVIKQTGGAANLTAGQVGKLSERLMQKNAIDDEAIQTGANLLLTFKNVRNEVGAGNKIFNQATAAALDLSASGFGSIDGSAKMLGKSLNDPVKGITALSRAGVTFSEGQKERIGQFVEENNLLGAQKIILGEVQSQVGGAAEAQKDAGDILTTSFGNIKESIGTALLPEIDRFASYIEKRAVPAGEKLASWLTDDGIPAVRKFGGWLRDEAAPAIGTFVDEARPLANEVLPAVSTALGTTRDILGEVLPLAKDVVGAFNDMPDWAKKAIVGGAVVGGAASKLGLFGGRNSGGVGGLLSAAKPVPVIVMNPGFGLPGTDVPGSPPKASVASRLKRVAGKAALVAAPYAAAYEADKLFPKAMPFGDQGWMPKFGGGPGGEPGGWLDLFKTDKVEMFTQSAEESQAALESLLLTPTRSSGMERLGMDLAEVRNRFGDLPAKVQTAILTPGLIRTRADVMDLGRKYDLTARDRKAVFRAVGLDTARREAEAAKRAMDLLRDKQITITTYRTTITNQAGPAYNAEDTAGGGASPKLPVVDPTERRGRRGRQPVVINLPDGRPLDGYVDDRVNANNALTGRRR